MEIMVRVDSNLKLFAGKKVFLTGHTGFKGSWLLLWLNLLGADVKAFALEPEHELCHYSILKANLSSNSTFGDIRNAEKLKQSIAEFQPDFIFHLAAQALVKYSYDKPIETYETNVIGTGNVILSCKEIKKHCVTIIVTTDKVYENLNWHYPYRENDRLGGFDPYSSSKACAELISSSFVNSFFHKDAFESHKQQFATVRAGNVIGGGDWAENRIIPDIIRSIGNGEKVILRSPNAVRPWQHVLEPLFGYLLLASKMYQQPNVYNDSWNFGPENSQYLTVEELTKLCIHSFGKGSYESNVDENNFHEAKLLQLDISKAKRKLNWRPKYNDKQTIQNTIDWYKAYAENPDNIYQVSKEEINNYMKS